MYGHVYPCLGLCDYIRLYMSVWGQYLCVCVWVCVFRVGKSGHLAVWCPPEGRAELLITKPGEPKSWGPKTSSSEYLSLLKYV